MANKTDEISMTKEGLEKLNDELYRREHEMRDEIATQLKEAREHGDLSENAEFDAAKEAQAQNESRINEIRQILAVAKTVEAGDVFTASVGTIVEIVDESGKHIEFALVGTTETNSLQHQISNESPIGSAVIGHRVGDLVEFALPSGKRRTATIESIRLP